MPEADPIPIEALSSDMPETLETPKEHDPMLDVHPAHHAANTWREFVTHIATIVLGLLIAVGLEQTVEYFHGRHKVAQTRQALAAQNVPERASCRPYQFWL
jgi:hypothetical protein